MNINDVNYPVDWQDIHNIRFLLFTNLYGNTVAIQTLTELLSRYIDCLSIEYSPLEYSFTIKIKKTTMRKVHGFNHDPNFYYPIISNVFGDFIKANEQQILTLLSANFEDPIAILHRLYANPFTMANLCHVSCMADNVIIVKL